MITSIHVRVSRWFRRLAAGLAVVVTCLILVEAEGVARVGPARGAEGTPAAEGPA